MHKKYYIPRLVFLAVLMTAAALLPAQQEAALSIFKYELNDKENVIQLFVKATEGGRNTRIAPKDIFVFDKFENEPDERLEIYSIIDKDSTAETGVEESKKFTVLFLMGLNSQYNEQSKNLIQSFADKINPPAGTDFFINAYGDFTYQPASLSLRDVDKAISQYRHQNHTFAELYKGLIEGIRFMKNKKGRKVIILLTDGSNVPNQLKYDEEFEIPYDTADVRYFLQSLGEDFSVFPMGVGANPDTALFRKMVKFTMDGADTFSLGQVVPDQLQKLLFAQRNVIYNSIVQVNPNPKHLVFKGEKRLLEVNWNGQKAVLDMSGIGASVPETRLLPVDYASSGRWLMYLALGFVIVLAALGLMSWLIPWSKQRAFRGRYIVPYKEEGGIRKRDPLSGELLKEGELVVVKCPRITSSLATWEYVNNQCPQYPRCMSFDPPCEGHGAPVAEDKFFSMKGIFRRLNWLWYGMVGGLIAYLLLALLNIAGYNFYYTLVQDFLQQSLNTAGLTIQELSRTVKNLTDELIAGTALGAGICSALSFVEEKSQPRRFSWMRVAVRTVAGIVVSLLTFMLGFYLQYNGIIGSRALAGLITWSLFGVAIGAVLSVESSISLGRGIIGGLVASLVAYLFYLLLLDKVFVNNFPLAKLVSLLSLGGILGLTLVTVVGSLEDFELEYLSPEAFRQTIPISKWLKKNIDVFIGTEQGSYVYVKWTDEYVKPRHVRLHFEKGVVFLEPLSETLVNGKIATIKKSAPLKDGDIIQLGRESVSRMRFREKRKLLQPRQEMKGGREPDPGKGNGGEIIIKR